MNALWRIELLGSLRATHGDRVVTQFRTQKAGSLLAYLAFHSRHPHPREALLELLWPELDLAASRNNLRFVLHSLRQLLEPAGVPAGSVLLADRSTVSLRPGAFATDVAELEAALSAAARAAELAEELRRSARTVIAARGTPSAPTADRRPPTADDRPPTAVRTPVGPALPPSDQRHPLEAPAGPSSDPALAVGGRSSAVGTLPPQ